MVRRARKSTGLPWRLVFIATESEKRFSTLSPRVLVNEKRKLLFAYTLGAASANEYYRRTRKFYERQGFSLALTPHGSAAEAAMAYYVKLLKP
jgi:hypothetical protein